MDLYPILRRSVQKSGLVLCPECQRTYIREFQQLCRSCKRKDRRV
jgi:hypothetical protein